MGSTKVVKELGDKTVRAKNFSTPELTALVQAVDPVYHKLFGKFDKNLTVESRENLWTVITEKVNAVSATRRSKDQIKEKFTSLKSKVKGKASQLLKEKKKTGGGEKTIVCMDDVDELLADSLSMWELKIVKLNGLAALTGVEGSFDSSEKTKKATDVSSSSTTTTTVALYDFENAPLVEPNDSFVVPETPPPSVLALEGENEDDTFTTTTTTNESASSSSSSSNNKRKFSSPYFDGYSNNKKARIDATTVVGENMLVTQEGILQEMKTMNGHLEELVKLQKLKLGLDPFAHIISLD